MMGSTKTKKLIVNLQKTMVVVFSRDSMSGCRYPIVIWQRNVNYSTSVYLSRHCLNSETGLAQITRYLDH